MMTFFVTFACKCSFLVIIVVVVVVVINLFLTRPVMVCWLVFDSRTRSCALRDSMSFSECLLIPITQLFGSFECCP